MDGEEVLVSRACYHYIISRGVWFWLVTTYVAMLLVGMAVLCMVYQRESQALDLRVQRYAETVEQSLNEVLEFSIQSVSGLRDPIIKAEAEAQKIYHLFLPFLDKGWGIVRFGWSNAEGRLVMSSKHGAYFQPPDISHRAYAATARNHPNQIYITHILRHIRTSVPIIGVVMGVQSERGRYLGALFGSINLPPLRRLVTEIMQPCECDYLVLSPRAERVEAVGDIARLLKVPKGLNGLHFHVVALPTVATIHAVQTKAIQRGAVFLLLFNGCFAAIWLVLRHKVILPVQTAIQAIEPFLVQGLPLKPMEKVERLGELLYAVSLRLEACESELDSAKSILTSLKQNRASFMQASSLQLEEAFAAIAVYSEQLDELVIAGTLDDDIPYLFDEVREAGWNMQYLSAGFRQLCSLQQQPAVLRMVRLGCVIDTTLERLSDAIERRMLDVVWSGGDGSVRFEPNILAQLIWALLFLVVRHAEDEARLSITVKARALTIHLSHFCDHLLPLHQHDFGHLMASFTYDSRADRVAYMQGHVNYLMTQSYLGLCRGALQIEATDDGILLTAQLHDWDESANVV